MKSSPRSISRSLGARIAAGRELVDNDDRAGAPPVAVISEPLWRRSFGGRPDAFGRSVLLNGTAHTVVGVAHESFTGSFVGAPIDAWVPIAVSGSSLGPGWNVDRSHRAFGLIGRLRRDVTLGQAESELQVIATGLANLDPAPTRVTTVRPTPGTLVSGNQRALARMFLSLLLGLVALVLLVACFNVANLLLARVLGRRRELAIRLALGAGRARLARMLIVESLLVAALGGSAAFIVSSWTTTLFSAIRPLPTLTLRLDLHPDVRVVAFTAGVTLAAAVLLGFVGAVFALKPGVGPALKEETATAVGGRSSARLRAGLATVQIALSLILLVGAALFTRSVREAQAIELGFDPTDVLALDLDNAGRTSLAASRRLFDDVLARVSALPRVEAVAGQRAAKGATVEPVPPWILSG